MGSRQAGVDAFMAGHADHPFPIASVGEHGRHRGRVKDAVRNAVRAEGERERGVAETEPRTSCQHAHAVDLDQRSRRTPHPGLERDLRPGPQLHVRRVVHELQRVGVRMLQPDASGA